MEGQDVSPVPGGLHLSFPFLPLLNLARFPILLLQFELNSTSTKRLLLIRARILARYTIYPKVQGGHHTKKKTNCKRKLLLRASSILYYLVK